MSKPPQKNILVCCSRTMDFPEEQVLQGIRRFALTQPEWRLGMLIAHNIDPENESDLLQWNPDGALITTPFSRVRELSLWKDLCTQVVDIRHEQPEGFRRIELHAEAAGEKAANYFIQHGFKRFAVVLWPRNPPFSRRLEQGFQEALHTAGVEAERFEITRNAGTPWYRNPELDRWLLNLPKPTGVFCVSDAAAIRVIEHCDRLDINLPSQLSLLSAGNHPSLCETIRPHLSSIHVRSKSMGFRAAQLLHQYLEASPSERNALPICEMLEPGEIVERQSSNLRAVEDPNIATAAAFLSEHVAQGVTLKDAADAAGINRRNMERGFKRHLDVTPGEYLRRVKFDYAKRLLTETDLRMNEVAHACGMAPEHFSTLFKKETGKTPGTYRKEQMPG